jgi:hypothetical protein
MVLVHTQKFELNTKSPLTADQEWSAQLGFVIGSCDNVLSMLNQVSRGLACREAAPPKTGAQWRAASVDAERHPS